MIRNALLIIIAWALFAAGANAQSKSPKKDTTGEVELTFANGSVLRMSLVADELEIITEYGPLTVPVREIRRIDFGLHLSEEMDKKIKDAIHKLASADAKERDEATRDLVSL